MPLLGDCNSAGLRRLPFSFAPDQATATRRWTAAPTGRASASTPRCCCRSSTPWRCRCRTPAGTARAPSWPPRSPPSSSSPPRRVRAAAPLMPPQPAHVRMHAGCSIAATSPSTVVILSSSIRRMHACDHSIHSSACAVTNPRSGTAQPCGLLGLSGSIRHGHGSHSRGWRQLQQLTPTRRGACKGSEDMADSGCAPTCRPDAGDAAAGVWHRPERGHHAVQRARGRHPEPRRDRPRRAEGAGESASLIDRQPNRPDSLLVFPSTGCRPDSQGLRAARQHARSDEGR